MSYKANDVNVVLIEENVKLSRVIADLGFLFDVFIMWNYEMQLLAAV